MLNKFFRFPFARSGDKTAIPDAVVPAGNVSYDQGYGPDYQRVKSDPLAKDIERDKMNQLFNDVTTALQEYQTNGVPDWIAPAQNGGVNYSYPIDAMVRYTDNKIYRSVIALNTDIPGATANWTLVWQEGVTPLAGVGLSGTYALTIAEYSRTSVSLSGTLSGAYNLVFPTIAGKRWIVRNTATGPYDVTLKTAAGTGVTIPSGQSILIWCDGVNIVSGGGTGRLANIQLLSATGTYTRTPGATWGVGEFWGGAAGGSGSVATSATQVSMGRGGGSGAYGKHLFAALPATQACTIGAGGTGGAVGGGGGGAGGDTVFGAITAPGAPATAAALAYTPPAVESGGLGAAVATGCNLVNSAGQSAPPSHGLTTSSIIGGAGAPSTLGGGANPRISSSAAGLSSSTRGAGGGSGTNGASTAGQVGGTGGNGLIIIHEYF